MNIKKNVITKHVLNDEIRKKMKKQTIKYF